MHVETAHRPWPVPAQPWVMAMRWHDLLFMHWPLDPAVLRPLVPASLELDTYDGRAWIGVVPFWMSGIRPRLLPPVPGLSRFPEINVRGGKPGVWFFSLDATSKVAVRGARWAFNLNYYDARISCRPDRTSGRVAYQATRTHRDAPPATFDAEYEPAGTSFNPSNGSLEHFLTERYCLYTVDPNGRPYRLEIAHNPWSLRPARARIAGNRMTDPIGIALPAAPPLLHLGGDQYVIAWLPGRA